MILKIDTHMKAHLKRLMQSYNGPLRNPLMQLMEDHDTLLKHVAGIEEVIKPIADLSGKDGEKYVRVPLTAHWKLVEAVKA